MKRMNFGFVVLVVCGLVCLAANAADEATDTPVTHQSIEGDQSLTTSRPWRSPEYANQTAQLGWNETAFAVPKGLETQVNFWIDIYSRYTTDQGVLHDSEYIDLVYDVLDFTYISSRSDLDGFQKERMKIKIVNNAKKRVVDMLKRFETLTDATTLAENEKRVWDYFVKVEGKKKFKEAAGKTRLRFQLGQRDRIVQGIFFSGRYLEEFERIFRDAGLPIELTRLVFVESSFNVLARSKVGASGLWQIMRYTGKPYMMINDAIDKRNHPTEATKLAARLFRNNYQMLQTWPLAVTGYNHGPSGVLRLTKLYKSRDLVDLTQDNGSKKRLGFASRNFYASFLAILEVEKNAPKYFGTVQWSNSLNSTGLVLPRALPYTTLLDWFDGDDHKAQIFNPHITSQTRKGKSLLPKGAVISVPQNKEGEVREALARPEVILKQGHKAASSAL
ncbi:MAG: lytic transglycosylase domain-containing protein [Bdellovibrio sp.]|jgi:membrane-bound lytic murein transglycosylase D